MCAPARCNVSQSPKQGIQSLNEEVIKSGPDGTAAIVNDEGVPVVVTGPSGKGRVALNGMLPGAVGVRDDGSARNLQAPTGAEWDLFLNTVRWLAGDQPSAGQP